MPSKADDPENGEKEPDSSGILGRLRSKKKRGEFSAHKLDEKRWTVNDLADEMQKLGLEPIGLGRFITSLHKLAVASGVNPSVLASIIKDLSSLAEGKDVSIERVHRKIHQLAAEQKDLSSQVAELRDKKSSLQEELGQRESEKAADKESFSQFVHLRNQLDEIGISINDLSRLKPFLVSAKEMGFDASAVVNMISDLKAAHESKTKADAELEQLLATKRAAQQRLLELEQEIAQKRKILDSVQDVAKLGLEPKDLDDLSAMIRMISKIRNIDIGSAKDRLIADLQSYYTNDHELMARLRTIEALVREKEDRFNMLETDFRNERAVLESASKLISSGLDEQWLAKLRSIIDSYGVDIDSLSRDLQARNGLNSSIEELAKTKKALEEEERILRQKVVATEDQRIKTLSMINNLIIRGPRAMSAEERQLDSTIQSTTSASRTPEFLTSAQKAIALIRAKLPENSPARLILEHALLALKLESKKTE
jgi:hypothetical protein